MQISTKYGPKAALAAIFAVLAQKNPRGMFDSFFEGFPNPEGGIDWKMRFPEIPKNMRKLYHFKRPSRQVEQRRQRSNHCRVVGGNHRQNQQRSFERWKEMQARAAMHQ